MDNLTKGALVATIVLMLGAMVFAMSSLSKTKELEQQNLALQQQILSDQRQREDDRNAATERRVRETEAKLEALREEMRLTAATARSEAEAMEAERAQLSATIAEKLRKEKLEEEQVLSPLQKKIRDAVAVGKVTEVNEELAFVVIGAGSAQGIQPGARFNVRRDKFIVAEVEIDSVVDARNSVANIDLSKLSPGLSVRPGDDVIGHPIY